MNSEGFLIVFITICISRDGGLSTLNELYIYISVRKKCIKYMDYSFLVLNQYMPTGFSYHYVCMYVLHEQWLFELCSYKCVHYYIYPVQKLYMPNYPRINFKIFNNIVV